jgi:glycosyltransferase involved in cell wall biosynthesis
MHYYDFELCLALQRTGVDVTLLTCDETAATNVPPSLPVAYPFQGIYGNAHKVWRGLRYLLALLSIGQAMRRHRVPLIHLHYHHFPPLDDLFSRWLHALGVRIVLTVHDVIPFDASSGQLGWLRRIYHRADRIIVHAQDNYETIVSQFDVPPARVHVIPMGPYLRFADEGILPAHLARQRLELDADAPVVLFFGQIKRVKGLEYLIRAFARVVQECPAARLVIAGPEWKESFEGYATLIGDLGLSDQVTTRIEYVPDEEVGTYYSAADVVALPYTEAYQSAVLYMAYSFSRPVVATNVGGLPEVVIDGESGLLVSPADADRLADALLVLLRDRARARSMGERGRLLVETEFGWKGIAQKTASVYVDALGGVPASNGGAGQGV